MTKKKTKKTKPESPEILWLRGKTGDQTTDPLKLADKFILQREGNLSCEEADILNEIYYQVQ